MCAHLVFTGSIIYIFNGKVLYIMKDKIRKEEVLNFQNDGGNAVVGIGKLYLEKKDYKEAAAGLVERFYGYGDGPVLFKPTRAANIQFRGTREGAVSYFVGDNKNFDEDTGFALQPWTNVRFENSGFVLGADTALAMGNYFFKTLDGDEKKVEYTMGLFRTGEGELRMNLHHSSLPFSPS